MRNKNWRWILAVAAALAMMMGAARVGVVQAAGGDTVLTAAEAGKLLPASVWFKGQSATTQLRNSGGVKFADGTFMLATMVDTSGYSSDLQEKYQAYLIVESPVAFEGKSLPAGVYGVGFVGGKFSVLDVGAHELLSVPTHTDADIKRAMPLKVTADGDGFRLYAGRAYVGFARAM